MLDEGFAGIVITTADVNDDEGPSDAADEDEPDAADEDADEAPELPEPEPEAEPESEPEPEPAETVAEAPAPEAVVDAIDDDEGDVVDEPAAEVPEAPEPIADEADKPVESVESVESVEPSIEAPVDAAETAGDREVEAEPADVDALFAKIRSDRAQSVARAQEVLAADAHESEPEPPAEVKPAAIEAVVAEADPGDGTADVGPGSDRVPAALLADEASTAARAEVVDPLDKKLARALKRHLADEQNVVLDALRRTESTDVADLLPPADDHIAGYATVAAVSLRAAAAAGAAAIGTESADPVDVDELAADLGASLVEAFRRRVERSAADVEGDADALDERLRALYREWKVEHIATDHHRLPALGLRPGPVRRRALRRRRCGG